MTDTRENTAASLEAIYAKIARFAAETNPIDFNAADSGHATSSNVVRLSQVIARRRRERPRQREADARLRLRDQCSPVNDLSKFSRGPEEDDYAHRMFMNLLAFLVLSFIVGCGIWLADNMSERNKDQDCGRISRTYCVPIPGPSETR
jgi:hypothetical protein